MTAWLSRIEIDRRHRAARSDLFDATLMHQRIMTLVPDGLGDNARSQTGVLYRIDNTRTGTQILVQTTCKPDPSRLPDGYGQVDVREIGPLLDALRPGSLIAYRVAANTSKRLGRAAGTAEGKVVALLGAAADEWWQKRAPGYGLELLSMRSQAEPTVNGLRRDERRVQHAVTRFDGTATVTDHLKLKEVILSGIGRGKSHGCGLLSVAPLAAPR